MSYLESMRRHPFHHFSPRFPSFSYVFISFFAEFQVIPCLWTSLNIFELARSWAQAGSFERCSTAGLGRLSSVVWRMRKHCPGTGQNQDQLVHNLWKSVTIHDILMYLAQRNVKDSEGINNKFMPELYGTLKSSRSLRSSMVHPGWYKMGQVSSPAWYGNARIGIGRRLAGSCLSTQRSPHNTWNPWYTRWTLWDPRIVSNSRTRQCCLCCAHASFGAGVRVLILSLMFAKMASHCLWCSTFFCTQRSAEIMWAVPKTFCHSPLASKYFTDCKNSHEWSELVQPYIAINQHELGHSSGYSSHESINSCPSQLVVRSQHMHTRRAQSHKTVRYTDLHFFWNRKLTKKV